MNVPRWLEQKRATLYILLVFLCGMAAGALGSNVWRNLERRGATARAAVPYSAQRTVEKFTQRFDLTPEQAQKLTVILDETRKAYQAHEKEQDAIRQHGRARIREILNEQQRAQYEEYLAQLDSRERRRR